MISSSCRVPGTIAWATSIDDVFSWKSSQTTPSRTSDGIAKIAAGRPRRLNACPRPGRTADRMAAKRRRWSVGSAVGPDAAGVHDGGGVSWWGAAARRRVGRRRRV